MRSILQDKLFKHPFVRRVSVLVGGTAIGQLIAILALPILTRLYTPDAFSTLAVYNSFLALITVIACLRLQIAIPLPKSDRVAAALCILSLISVVFISVLSGVAVLLIPEIFNKLTNNKISQYLWLIPLGVLSVGMYNALQYWSTRKKKFSLIAKTRITQSLSGTGVKLGSGFLAGGGWTAGLIVGQFLSQGAGFLSLGLNALKNDKFIFKRVRGKDLRLALIRYQNFPKYSTLEAFTNVGGIQIPILLIAYYAVGAEAGYLMIAMQLLSAPMSLLGSAIAQVYLSEGAERYHQGDLERFTKSTVLNLAKIAFLPLLLVGVLAPTLMPYVLGDNWQRTGILMAWMVPWFYIQFITSPVSMSLHITGNQKLAFLLQAIGLLIRVGSVMFTVFLSDTHIGEVYAVSGFVFYIIYFFVILNVISK